jgi:cobalt-zinc-cadmium efflux system protein
MGTGHHHHGHEHDHPHDHDHGHGHAHARAADLKSERNRRRLGVVLLLTLGYMGAEVVGGYLSGSLALIADAGHMLSDAGALGLSFFALWVARRPPDRARTFGYHRVEILAALGHALSLLLVAVFVVWEALERLRTPPEVQGPLMLGIAVGGLAVNVVGLVVLHGGQHESLNVRGAWLHVLTDALGSVGVIISAGLVWAFGWRLADPVASMILSALVLISAFPLLRRALGILMEGAPHHIDVAEVQAALAEVSGVAGVHDLHVWSISEGRECLSGHVVVAASEDQQAILRTLRGLLADRFGVEHVTLQIEHGPCPPHQVCS